MKGFIEITPKYWNEGDFMRDIEGRWITTDKIVNLNTDFILEFGENYITCQHFTYYVSLSRVEIMDLILNSTL